MYHEIVDQPTESGLIFDCDGTLADTMPLHFLSWHEVMNDHGIEFTEDRFYALAGQPTVHIIEKLMNEQEIHGDARALADEKEHRFLELIPRVQPIKPIVRIARNFRQRCRLGVGSGSSRDSVHKVLEQIGLANLFDAVVGAEDTPNPKPAPDVFLEVARRIGVAPGDCRVYEDADLGIEAAHRAGMSSFDIRTVHTPRRIQ